MDEARDTVLGPGDFTLRDARVVGLPEASGGKAVLLDRESSAAEAALKLDRGVYRIWAHLKTRDAEHDSIWVSVRNQKWKIWSEDWGRMACRGGRYGIMDIRFLVEDDNPVPMRVAAKETGVLLDRLVVRRLPREEFPVWTHLLDCPIEFDRYVFSGSAFPTTGGSSSASPTSRAARSRAACSWTGAWMTTRSGCFDGGSGVAWVFGPTTARVFNVPSHDGLPVVHRRSEPAVSRAEELSE